jgi:hypothetical protein
MAAAAARAQGPTSAAAASAAVFDAQLESVVDLGWASIEKFCYTNFLEVRDAPERKTYGRLQACVKGALINEEHRIHTTAQQPKAAMATVCSSVFSLSTSEPTLAPRDIVVAHRRRRARPRRSGPR